MVYVVSLICGVLFGFGLAVSRMVNPAKVINFFDVAGNWDGTLGLVFLGALIVATPGYQWVINKWQSPVLVDEFNIPESKAINLKILGGSAIFGVGWGIAGFCPGPGITALATLLPGVIVWVVAMLLGAASYRFLLDR